MIRYIHNDDGFFPVVECDACGKTVQAATGRVCWDDNGNIKYTHLGTCSRSFDRPEYMYWEQLSVHLYHLLHNVGFGEKDLKEARQFDDILGASTEKV